MIWIDLTLCCPVTTNRYAAAVTAISVSPTVRNADFHQFSLMAGLSLTQEVAVALSSIFTHLTQNNIYVIIEILWVLLLIYRLSELTNIMSLLTPPCINDHDLKIWMHWNILAEYLGLSAKAWQHGTPSSKLALYSISPVCLIWGGLRWFEVVWGGLRWFELIWADGLRWFGLWQTTQYIV